MNDLISRQAAIRFIRDKVSLSLFMKRSVDKADKACMELCDMLDRDLPSEQPRNGEWIDYSDEGYVECPFCHSATNCEGNKDELHYCFSCGAELR